MKRSFKLAAAMVAVAATLATASLPAAAADKQFIPLLAYRTGSFAPLGIPFTQAEKLGREAVRIEGLNELGQTSEVFTAPHGLVISRRIPIGDALARLVGLSPDGSGEILSSGCRAEKERGAGKQEEKSDGTHGSSVKLIKVSLEMDLFK